jgi:hypothetical protein
METKMRIALVALVSLLSAGTGALAQSDFRGTVNEVTPAEETRAKAAITHAGYQPTEFQFAQAGNLFFTVSKGDEIYGATVTPRGEVFVSNGLPASRSADSRMD